MFSRLASRTSSAAMRSLLPRSRATLAPALSRAFSSKWEMQNGKWAPAGSSAPAAEASALNPAEVIQKYGATSFWGMVAAILVSKELFILDAEFLLSCEIAAFVLTGYVLTGDTLTKMSEEWDAKTKAKFEGANDFMIEMFNQYKMVQSTVQHKPAVLQQYHDELKAANEAHAKFLTVKPQHEARAQVIAALQQIQAKEEHAASLEWQNTVDAAVAEVTKAFQGDDAKLKSEMMDLAINNLGFKTPQTTDAEDPVKRLFMKQFQE